MHFSELGFDTYDEYIAGEEWQTIREMKYKSGDPYRCRLCWGRRELRLHKRTYYDLTPEFFYFLLKNNRRIYNKILVWLCPRCNTLVHWYDGKKQKKKVPLDYLFLWDRECQVYNRPDIIMLRFFNITIQLVRWIWVSYQIERRKRRRF